MHYLLIVVIIKKYNNSAVYAFFFAASFTRMSVTMSWNHTFCAVCIEMAKEIVANYTKRDNSIL